MAKTPFLTNREFLREIHESKTTYCEFTVPAHAAYDAVVHSLDEVTPGLIEELIRDAGRKTKHQLPRQITSTDLVFRLMTLDHVPLDPERNRQSGRSRDLSYAYANFPPFKHFMLDGRGGFIEVGRSHWRGDFIFGDFDPDRGRMTDRLGVMIMLLIERYARRANFRHYSYRSEMESAALVHLVKVALSFNEARSDNPFSYLTQVTHHSFLKVLKDEKRHQEIRDDLMEMEGYSPSYTRQMNQQPVTTPATTTTPAAAPRPRGRPRKVSVNA